MKTFAISTVTKHVVTYPELVTFAGLSSIILNNIYSPFTFRNEMRSADNSNGTEILVFDFDDGLLSLSEAINCFRNYKHIIGTTNSHQKIKKDKPAVDRFRVILFFNKFLSEESAYKFNFERTVNFFNVSVDMQCKDFARYFNPCIEIVSANENGDLVETYDVPADFEIKKIKKMGSIPNNANCKKIRFRPLHKLKGVLSHRTRDFLSNQKIPASSSWHSEFIWAVADLRGQAYTFAEAYEALKSITGHLDDNHDIPQLEWAYYQSNFTVEYRYPALNYQSGGGR